MMETRSQAAHPGDHRHVRPDRRDDRDARRRGQQHLEGDRRFDRARPQPARRRHRVQARADRQPHHRDNRGAQRQGHRDLQPERRGAGDHRSATRGDAVRDMLGQRLQAFEEMFNHGGAELAERIGRDSATLGNLITRHLTEFDRTVKTYGGELVERLGQRTQDVNDGDEDLSRRLRQPRRHQGRRGHQHAGAAPCAFRGGAGYPDPDAQRHAQLARDGHRQNGRGRRQGSRLRARQAHRRRHRHDQRTRHPARRDDQREDRRNRQRSRHPRARGRQQSRHPHRTLRGTCCSAAPRW